MRSQRWVADTSALSVGMDVAVGWVITDVFVAEHQMSETWKRFNGTWRPFFRRSIVAIDGDNVTVDRRVDSRSGLV